MPSPRWLFLFAFVAGLLVAPAAARACSGCNLPPSLGHVTLRPANGQMGVPTNTLVWVDYDGSGPIPTSAGRLTLRPEGEAAVDAALERLPAIAPDHRCQSRLLVRMRPLAPLRPDTTYEVLDEIAAVPCQGEACDVPRPRVLGFFTTGAGADTSPPRFAGVSRWHNGPGAECNSGACCGPYKATYFDVEGDPATDDGGIALYEVSLDGQVVDALPAPSLRGFAFCSGEAVQGPPAQLRPGGHYRFNAVDLAGNRDSNSRTISVSPSCGGCSYGGRKPAAPLTLAAVALLVFGRRSQR